MALVDYFSHRKPSLSVYLREVPREIALVPEALNRLIILFFLNVPGSKNLNDGSYSICSHSLPCCPDLGCICEPCIRPHLKKGRIFGINPLVSILIPARNEENNIGRLLDDLQELKYNNFEILVYDDDSTDQTRSVIMDKSLLDKRIRYIQGKVLLPGWLGKNHACHQLAKAAKGDYLLFLDADVSVIPRLFTDSIAFMEKQDLDLLSLFPVQKMKTLGEWLTVPLMNRILLGNLPADADQKKPVA